MRGKPEHQLAMLSCLTVEGLIPNDHPIRKIRRIVDEVLAELDDGSTPCTPSSLGPASARGAVEGRDPHGALHRSVGAGVL